MAYFPVSLLTPRDPFDRPSLLHTLLTQPLHLLLRLTSHLLTTLRPQPNRHPLPIRLVLLSDTHSLNPGPIPPGDILIHAGDLTAHGTLPELQRAITHLSTLPHAHKFLIAGNHDTYLDPSARSTLPSQETPHPPLDFGTTTYLQHTTRALYLPPQNRSLHLHGSPQTPLPNPTFAFTYQPTQNAWKSTVPRETDVLITHTPPAHHLDLPAALGCPYLLAEVRRVQPRLHVFGHVHAGRSDFEGWLKGGRERVVWDAGERALTRGLQRRARGLVLDVWNLGLWWDWGCVVWHGVSAVLWERVWGGRRTEAETLMVNAAMMFEDEGWLGNGVQVVDI